MPRTCWCKKCGQEMPVGDTCPVCGGKLNPSRAHLVWQVPHIPVLDWLCWNGAARIVLPVLGAVAMGVTLLEVLLGGLVGLENLLMSGFPGQLLLALLVACVAVLLVLYLRGEDILKCTVDSRGVMVQVYLPQPTPLKLICRGKRPDALEESAEEMMLVEEKMLDWRSICRVQRWPGRTQLLLYAPRWWMRLSLPCTPQVWTEVQDMFREKLGKGKQVELPKELRANEPAKRKAKVPRADQHPAPFMKKTEE